MLESWMAAQFKWRKGLLNDRQVHHPRVHRQHKLVHSTHVPVTISETLRNLKACEEQDQTHNKSITSKLNASHLRSEGQ